MPPGSTHPAAASLPPPTELRTTCCWGMGWRRAACTRPGATGVGIVLNLMPVWPERAEAADAADGVDAIQNRVWLGPLVDGAYDGRLRALAPPLDDSAVVRDGDLALVQGSADWLGVNYYTPARVDSGGAGKGGVGLDTSGYPGVEGLGFAPRPPLTAMGWEVEPRGLEELLIDVHRRTSLPLVVTENGAAYDDTTRAADGSVDDQDRIAYLREHIAAVERARDAGADVRTYVAWTLLDNFEWARGLHEEVRPGRDGARNPPTSAQGVLRLVRAAHPRRWPHPLRPPASRPRTKKRCRLTNTITGRAIETKAPAESRCHALPAGADEVGHDDRDRLGVGRAERRDRRAGRSTPTGTGRCRTPRSPG